MKRQSRSSAGKRAIVGAVSAGVAVCAGKAGASVIVSELNAPVNNSGGQVIFDYDNDATSEATINVNTLATPNYLKYTVDGNHQAGNGGSYVADANHDVANEPVGTIVGPSTTFDEGASSAGLFNPGPPPSGEFPASAGIGYIAVRINLSSEGSNADPHYGYIEYKTTNEDPANLEGEVIGYAYETDPNTAITIAPVPEPSLGLLAMGAAGLASYRGRRKARD